MWPNTQSTKEKRELSPISVGTPTLTFCTQLFRAVDGMKRIRKLCDYIQIFLHCPRVKISLRPKFFKQNFLKNCIQLANFSILSTVWDNFVHFCSLWSQKMSVFKIAGLYHLYNFCSSGEKCQMYINCTIIYSHFDS